MQLRIVLQKNGGQIKSNISEKIAPIVQDVQNKWNTLKDNAVNTWRKY
jgi:hypothetical protein